MQISFFGACGEVTGSNFLLATAGKKILFDCGLFQGVNSAEERNYAQFPFDAKTIDFVVICHAHLDHVGRLPKLAREGFRGKIFSTAPTKELAGLVLEDNEKLMREEAERNNHAPLYTKDDIAQVMVLFEALTYKQTVEIAPNIKITFKNAGHILGSAVVLLEAEGKKLVYSSDLGNNPSLLLDPPETFEDADYIVCESTYGGRIHEDVSLRLEKLAKIISETVAQNGVLIIPSFAIERTQELLHDIENFCTTDGCEKPDFYLDSPLAQKVTSVFGKYPEYLRTNIRNGQDLFGLDRLRITGTVEESKSINDASLPKVIIAGSGMMNGGRILYHALRYLTDENNALLFVGYQAQGTLGRRLFEGEGEVKIFGEKVKVKAQIKSIGSYSAHADMPQLLDWIGSIAGCRRVFVCHGEVEQASILAAEIREQLKVDAQIPEIGQVYTL